MIISFSIQKGGAGKTVGAVFLSQYLSFIKNYKVLLIDMDPQGNATRALLKTKDVSLYDVFIKGADVPDVIRETKIKSLHMIPASIDMEHVETHFRSEAAGPNKLKNLIRDYALESKYDFILIDTPPHLGRLTISSIVASDFILIPLQGKIFAADGLGQLIKSISMAKEEFNAKVDILGAFLNQFDSRPRISRRIIELYQAQPDVVRILMDSKIRYNITVEECIGLNENVFTYDPESHIAIDFVSLGEEVLSRLALRGILIHEAVEKG